MPMSRGRRCVPPPPGSRPRVTSGWPNFALSNRNPDGAGHRGLAAATERKPIDGRDYRLAEILDEIKDFLSETAGLLRCERRGMRELTDVGARDKGFVARAGRE